jgi:transposase
MLDARSLPDLETLDPAALKALIVAQHDELLSHKHEIEHLQLLIAKLRRMLFGRSSEKISRQIEQLELRLEELESARAERGRSNTRTASPADAASAAYGRALPEHLPREVHTHLPPHEACPECGGQLRRLGEDVSEMLERIPATYMVIRHVRPKFSCGRCQHIVQARLHRAGPWSARSPGRHCWPTYSPRSSAITCRSIARRRSPLVRAWSWSARRSLTGWAESALSSNR